MIDKAFNSLFSLHFNINFKACCIQQEFIQGKEILVTEYENRIFEAQLNKNKIDIMVLVLYKIIFPIFIGCHITVYVCS